MAIAPKPKRAQTDAAAEFIKGDEPGAGKRAKAPRKPVIARFDAVLLERVDRAAERNGVSRSAYLQMAVNRVLTEEGF